jgi:hypothetical protein
MCQPDRLDRPQMLRQIEDDETILWPIALDQSLDTAQRLEAIRLLGLAERTRAILNGC